MPINKAGKTGLIALLSLSLLAAFLYLNRKKLVPHVKEVTYLRADLETDTAQVNAGLLIRNWLPFTIAIDSVKYKLRHNDIALGWGKHQVKEILPAVGTKEMRFSLKLFLEKYRDHLQANKGSKDSIDINVAMQVFFKVPFLDPKSITITRNITAPVPKAPMMQLDSVQVAGFTPETGYKLLLHITTGNKSLPGLKIQDFSYDIDFSDGKTVTGKIDSTFKIKEGAAQLQVPVEIATADAIDLIKKKLQGSKTWAYQAKASAVLQSSHALINDTRISVVKSGELRTGNMAGGLAGGKNSMPTLHKVAGLQLISDEENTFLVADVIIDNPGPLPLYIDSASYFVRNAGQVVASGKKDFEVTLPKEGKKKISIKLKADNDKLQGLKNRARQTNQLPLNLELNLVYDLPDNEPQKLTLHRKINLPLPSGGAGLELEGIQIKEIGPVDGVQLLLQLKTSSESLKKVDIKNLAYELTLGDKIDISGEVDGALADPDSPQLFNVPVRLSALDTYRLISDAANGTKKWPYQLSASAVLQTGKQQISNTAIKIKKSGELDLGSNEQGSLKNMMPELLKIDTANISIHYDSARFKVKAQLNNPLPIDIVIDSIHVRVRNPRGLVAIVRSPKAITFKGNKETGFWLTGNANYKTWNEYNLEHQHLDKLDLEIEATIFYQLADLFNDKLQVSRKISLQMPYTPLAIVEKVKPRGLGLRQGVKLYAFVKIRNASLDSLEAGNIQYNVQLGDFADFCGTLNCTHHLPVGQTIVKVPFNLTPWEAVRTVSKRFFGKRMWHTQLNTTLTLNAAIPMLKNTVLVIERKKMTDSRSTGKTESQPDNKQPDNKEAVSQQ